MGVPFTQQANALVRNKFIYQARNTSTNCRLISAPIYFCVLLLIIRLLINNIFLSGPDFKCGCQCLSCVHKDSPEMTLDVSGGGYCPTSLGYKCESFNKENCDLIYSSSVQSVFCKIPDPSVWPSILQIPNRRRRASAYRPSIAILMTDNSLSTASGASLPAASLNLADVSAGLVSAHTVDNVMALAAISKLFSEDGSVDGSAFTDLGFTLGTNADIPNSLFIEPGLAGADDLYHLMSPRPGFDHTCTSLGFDTNASLPLMLYLQSFVLQSSGTELSTDSIVSVIDGKILLAALAQLKVQCLDVVFPQMPQPAYVVAGAGAVSGSGVSDLDRTLYCGFFRARCDGSSRTNEYAGAFDFRNSSASELDVTVYYNGTESGTGAYLRISELVSAPVTAWLAGAAGVDETAADGTKVRGLMDMPKPATKLNLDFSTLLGQLFFTWVVQLLLPTFVQQIVQEKEDRLRMMMKMHGLSDTAYWLITYSWNILLYCVYMILFIVVGAAINLKIFRLTSGGLQVLFYFIFGNNLVAFAFLVSSFFRSSRTAVVSMLLYVFASGLIGQLLLNTFIDQRKSWMFFVQWIPAFSLYRGLYEMNEYTFLGVYKNEFGLTFDKLSEPGCGMIGAIGILVVQWPIFIVLGWYLEQVLGNGTGVRRHPLFFLESCGVDTHNMRLFRNRKRKNLELNAESGKLRDHESTTPAGKEREDVAAERIRVEGILSRCEAESSAALPPIIVSGLQKVFPPLDGGREKVAVRELSLAIEHGECFGLLGPNGAGKSTSINMLTGFLEPSGGVALVDGMDTSARMLDIYQVMGVCPQHDLLWGQLTAEEHLRFYGRLKGLRGAELESEIERALRSVNLFHNKVGQKQSAKYSGGMRRRLSVAISFMGNPKVVYLDEPSTGLDPASRRNLWEVVKANKPGRAIVLTTHSLEEAEQLCDRLGIFVDGSLTCIGNPREITNRYAGHLLFTVTVTPEHEHAAHELVTGRMSAGARLTYKLGGTSKYELPVSDVTLGGVFAVMERVRGQLDVLDWGVASATLEEVFIKFTKEAGIESKE